MQAFSLLHFSQKICLFISYVRFSLGGGAGISGLVSAWLVRVFDFTRAVRFLGGVVASDGPLVVHWYTTEGT